MEERSFLTRIRDLIRLMGLRNAFTLKVKQYLGFRPIAARVRGAAFPLIFRPGVADYTILMQIFLDRELDLELPFSPLLIVDGGANVGYASAFYATKYPDATIIAIEPSDANFTLLVENTRRYKNVRTLQAALWNADATLVIENPTALPAAFRVRRAEPTEPDTFPGISIPGLMARMKIDHIDLLKLDIEGAEEQLFDEGSHDWIGRVGAIVVELHGRSAREAVYRVLDRHNFTRFEQGERTVFVRTGT